MAVFTLAACSTNVVQPHAAGAKKTRTPTAATAVADDKPLPCQELDSSSLLGRWSVRFGDGAAPSATATLVLGPNPRWTDSVFGEQQRSDLPGVHIQVAGEVDRGALSLEESNDGSAIAASWEGESVQGECGQRFVGTWISDDQTRQISFEMRKLSNSQ